MTLFQRDICSRCKEAVEDATEIDRPDATPRNIIFMSRIRCKKHKWELNEDEYIADLDHNPKACPTRIRGKLELALKPHITSESSIHR
jgi:predicted transposase YbfD/YdcC